MTSLPRIPTVPRTPSSLTSHREWQESEPTKSEKFVPKELPAPPRPSTDPKDPVERKPLSPGEPTVGDIGIATLFAAFGLASAHSGFAMIATSDEYSNFPQYWVKIANNAFSVTFSICIVSVAANALTQIKWNVARSKPLSIMTIDKLFALPPPVALFTIVTGLRSPLLLPIFTAIFIQCVALVTIFAPSALAVAPRNMEKYRNITVPTLDLSKGPLTSIPATRPVYNSVPPLWTTILTSITLQPPLSNWKIPAGCGAACTFELVYDAPGLQCMDTPFELPPYTGEDLLLVYNATSSLYPTPPADPSSSWEIDEQYELKIGYIATNNSSLNIGRDGGSVHCVFRNATYKASFQVENNTMQANHSIQSYGDVLGTVKYGESDRQCSGNSSQPCFINGVNTRAMCDVFASALTGQIRPPRVNLSEAVGLTEITGGINEAVIDLLFSHAYYSVDTSFHLAVSNLSESLVSLFSNLTLGFIAHRDDTTTVRAMIWDGNYGWTYTMWFLWACYLPALIPACFLVHNRWLNIRSNKRVIDDKFSNFLLATRDTELDDLCMNAKDLAELLKFRLLYQMEKGTFSVASGGDYAT